MTGTFQRELGRFRRRWRLGLLGAGLLSALFWSGLALLTFGVLDGLAGFSDPSRRVVAAAIGAIGGAALLYGLWEALVFARRAAAREADAARHDPRREILSALELGAEPVPAAPLARWLRQNAIDAARERLRQLAGPQALPRRELWKHGLRVLVVLGLAGACFLLAPGASRLIGRRLLDPEADLPPWSKLRFAVSPAPAEVLYGGDLVVSAEITGGEISGPVRVLTRDPSTGRRDEAPAYRETEARYSQKLEKVSAPVEVAFAVGRARSAWLPVQVRTQPRVQEVVLTVQPPPYSRLPQREFAAGTQLLAVLAGTRLTARVTSNRPLATGALQIFAGAPGSPATPAAVELEGPNRLRFTWVARQAARLALTVRDVLNTASEPLEFEQKIVPDERPEVILREPSGLVLATPDGEIPLEYSASDDLGLSRLALVRRLGAFRERAAVEPVLEGTRRHEVRGKISLAPYGLTPGQTIELSAEAADTNPTLLGVSTSETARIRIITREEYAEKLRRQTTLDEFTARYEAIDHALDEAREALAELDKAAASGDPARTAAAREKALEAHQRAGKTFGEIARDFPIFDLDQSLSASAADVMKKLFDNAQELENLAGKSPGDVAAATPTLRQRLGAAEQRIEQDARRGERAAKAGAVMEQAEHFRELVQTQADVVKDLNRVIEAVRRGEMSAAQALPEMEKRQRAGAQALGEFEKNLGAAVQDLPPEFSKLRAGTEEFLKDYRESRIPPVMEEGAAAAASADGQTAGARAGEALALMEALLRKKNLFSQLAQGDDQDADWPEDLADTMRQLMDSLCRKPGANDGEGEGDEDGKSHSPGGSGAGPAGHSPHGYSMRGKMRQLPIYGPTRLRRAQGSTSGALGQEGGPGAGRAGEHQVQRDEVAAAVPRPAGGESVAPEAVPEAYREAVKRYFSTTP